jgi:hypothetical protein
MSSDSPNEAKTKSYKRLNEAIANKNESNVVAAMDEFKKLGVKSSLKNASVTNDKKKEEKK